MTVGISVVKVSFRYIYTVFYIRRSITMLSTIYYLYYTIVIVIIIIIIIIIIITIIIISLVDNFALLLKWISLVGLLF